ncbi:MAG: replication initiation protein [Bacteroidota bacterium]
MENAQVIDAPGSLVVKGNQLINSRYTLSLAEMRIFLLILVQIGKNDQEFKRYRIRIRDYAEAIGSRSKSIHKELKNTVRNMLDRKLYIPKDKGGWLQMNLIASGEYIPEDGILEIEITPKLRPYLLGLKDNFTTYDIKNVLSMQSFYSVRIYEMLKKEVYHGRGLDIRVEELREKLDIGQTQYKSYNLFKKRVILQAQKELLAKSDLSFEFDEIKEGRRVARIFFKIQKQERPISGFPLLEGTRNQEEQEELIQELRALGLSLSQAEELVGNKDLAKTKNAIQYTKENYRERKGTENEIRNPGAYLIKILEKETSDFEKAEAASTAKAQEEEARLKEAREKVAEEKELLTNIYKEYQQARNEEIELFAQKAEEKDWGAFEEYARNNIYLSKKFFEGGILKSEDEEIGHWLGSFLLEQAKPDSDEAFINWTYKKHGIHLAVDKSRGEVPFKVIGKQEALF